MFARRQEYCKKLHGLIDKIDEDRYDVEAKVQKADKEVNSSRQNHADRLTDRKLKQKAFSLLVDWGSEDQGGGSDRREETRSEESAHVRRHHAEGSAGHQAHGQHGPEDQPEAGQEGDEGGGECVTPVITQLKVEESEWLYYWNED